MESICRVRTLLPQAASQSHQFIFYVVPEELSESPNLQQNELGVLNSGTDLRTLANDTRRLTIAFKYVGNGWSYIFFKSATSSRYK